MKVTIHGTGYVGLVTGTCFADAGHSVVCVDINPQRVASLNQGIVPIYEPGLDAMIAANTKIGRIRFTTSAQEGVDHGQLQFIAVGTPPLADGTADTRYVMDVARSIGKYMTDEKTVVDKSTVPVGTADQVQAVIRAELERRGLTLDFDVCSNPEFLKEGSAIEDFTEGSRIVVGAQREATIRLMRECYAPYNRNHDKMILMDVRSAELTKYAANAMLATKISFINEMASLADRLGADVEQVRRGIGSDPRIGYHFISPGCGYGGSCLPKDVQALISTAREAGFDTELLRAVETINARQKHLLFSHLAEAFDGRLEGRTIALWGLAFKPNTDDMRDAPSRALMQKLWSAGARVQAYDPKAMDECVRLYGQRSDLLLGKTQYDVLDGADALVVCTDWTTFRTLDIDHVKRTLKYPIIVDGRNLYDPSELKAAGIRYYCIGRHAVSPTSGR